MQITVLHAVSQCGNISLCKPDVWTTELAPEVFIVGWGWDFLRPLNINSDHCEEQRRQVTYEVLRSFRK